MADDEARATASELTGLLPIAMLADAPPPERRRPRLVVAQAYATALTGSFSGSTYYMAQSGIAEGEIDGAFGLAHGDPRRDLQLNLAGAAWKAGMKLRRRSTIGFKFMAAQRSRIWSRLMPSLRGHDLINNYQLYAPAFHARRKDFDIGAFIYTDGPLVDYFETYAPFDTNDIHPDVQQAAIEEERAGFAQMDAIITMSEQAADVVKRRCGVDPGRVFVVPPGCNIADADVGPTPLPAPAPGAPFVLGFIGIFPLRKGIDRAAEAVRILRAEGLDVRLQVVGTCPPEIAAMDGVDDLGFINKRADPQAFVAAMRNVSLGCLLSRAELAGISVLEFLRFGIPVVGSGVGGMKDVLGDSGTITVPNEAPIEQLVAAIRTYAADPAAYAALRAKAAERIAWTRWARAVAQVGEIVESFSSRKTAPAPGDL